MLEQIQFPLAILWGIVFLAILFWVAWKQKKNLTTLFVVRHFLFNLFSYLAVFWFIYENEINALIFGKEVVKHSPEEIPAVLITLGGVIFWFAVAVIVLGKNRVKEFGCYIEAFKLKR